MNKEKQETTTEVAETYTLYRPGEPDDGSKRLYIATIRGVNFIVGYFATYAEASAAVEANLTEYIARLEPKPAYRVEQIGTVTVDTGTILILDPCRIGRIAATQDDYDLLSSPLYPNEALQPGDRLDDVKSARQILDPHVPAKENPKGPGDYGTSAGHALSLKTGSGDGEYSVIAEIVDFGEPFGQRIASIHIQFLADEDIESAKDRARAVSE